MAKKSEEKRERPGFEDLLTEAEALAERVDAGGLSLEESLAAYEKGMANLRLCAGLLRAAEEKVKVLIEKNGAFRLEDLNAENGEDADAGGEGY